ncbi:MAG: ceramidase domain-containing protein [Methylococcaceae bacterium]
MTIYNHRIKILLLITIFSIVIVLFFGRIPQDLTYHNFADSREIIGIHNFWNIFSNLPFLLIGLYGFWRGHYLIEPKSKSGYKALCTGVFLVGIGSAYYHYNPSNSSLLWDRLPMTVAFMALFSILVDERIISNNKSPILWLFLAIGISSIIYWYWTEKNGIGDLRLYVLVQFLPMLLIPVILLLFKSKYLHGNLLLISLGLYATAKLFEHFDKQLLETIGFISGHTIKHFLASLAAFYAIISVPINKNKRAVS